MGDQTTINLSELLREASQTGAVKLPLDGESFYLIRPRLQLSGGTPPFDGSDTLLAEPLPLRRMAYSDRTAWLMACMALLAYSEFENGPEEEARLVADLAQAGILLLKTFNCPMTSTQAFLAQRPGDFRVLAFRGTEDKKDAITDMRAMFRATPFGRTHEGFVGAFESVEGDIKAALAENRTMGKAEPLILCGHSLGGALATVATRMLAAEGEEISACYTFGSPRVGDDEFADSFKTPVYRVVNRADPVPMVPASGALRYIMLLLAKLPGLSLLAAPLVKFMDSGFVGYQHVGDMRLLLGEDGTPTLKSGSAATISRFRYMFVKYLFNPRAWVTLPKIGADHGMAHYVAKLRLIAKDRNNPPTPPSAWPSKC
jgi:triacylglycerol lipase